MVPCEGLYADIADDSRYQQSQQNMIKGITLLRFLVSRFFAGFDTLSLELAMYSKKVDDELRYGHQNTALDGERLQKALWQILSSQEDPKANGLRLSIAEYIKYKERYVKHLQFDPNLHNLSKFQFPQHFRNTVFYFQLP